MKNVRENNTVVTTMSKAYQITVPSVMRKALGLIPGDSVDIKLEKGRMVITRAETHEEKVKRAFAELDKWRESLPDETKELIKKHAGWTVNQYHEYYDNLPETKAYLEKKYGVKVA